MHFAVFEHGKEIVGSRLHQFLVSQSVKSGRLEHAVVALAAAEQVTKGEPAANEVVGILRIEALTKPSLRGTVETLSARRGGKGTPMSCARTRNLLDAWLDHELDAATGAQLASHVNQCAACATP